MPSAHEEAAKWTSDVPKQYEDYREMLEKEKPDIAIVATPDHWHPLPTIAAVKAGAHVYVEKPIGHTIMEGRAMVNAARAAGRVVQVGTHRRVSPHNVSGRKFLREGNAGKIGMVRCFVLYGGDGPEKPRKNVEPPKELNWDLWCGPAPLRPFNGGAHPRGFRSYLDYANGTLGDWGVHWMDQVRWIMDVKWPKSVHSHRRAADQGRAGPHRGTSDDRRARPPGGDVCVRRPDGDVGAPAVRGQPRGEDGERRVLLLRDQGDVPLGWQQGWTFYPTGRGQQEIHEEPKLNLPDEQNIKELWADFLDAIETGRRPVCDIEEVHYSTNLSLLGMLSYKLGRSVRVGRREGDLRGRRGGEQAARGGSTASPGCIRRRERRRVRSGRPVI